MNKNNVMRMSIESLLDFADGTNQLEHFDGMLSFYMATYNNYKKSGAEYQGVSLEHLSLLDTVRCYDLSWHHDYKLIFEDYYQKKQLDKFKSKDKPEDNNTNVVF
jgi:hypothetical protein